ncbi:hypothetical protein [Blastococcus sp. CT_GayMR16]|uniref:hypothetical protein n=1 Tax=Blastococcus sp. CT_GayMR16 TaxID=2559607 RepID=UPI001073A54C|nr:hypothetical protein [Blastococcus sp. CT_GayMR16]TFV81345.1 hypothetical protein E4P38_22445 [Blastococcus sp. CT_GayMR16]
MTEQSPTRPVPGPPLPVAAPPPADVPPPPEPSGTGEDRFADLDEQPVAEHVAVFEAEHSRLQRELGTIDQL